MKYNIARYYLIVDNNNNHAYYSKSVFEQNIITFLFIKAQIYCIYYSILLYLHK